MTVSASGSEIGAVVHRQHDHLGTEANMRIAVGDIFVGERMHYTFEIRFLDSGVEAYAFTFG